MKILMVENLKAGMKFSKAVYMDTNTILVPEHVALRKKDIERLKKWGIRSVQTEGEVLGGDSLLSKKIPGDWEFPSDEDVENSYVSFLGMIKELLSDIGAKRPVDTDKIRALSLSIITEVGKKSSDFIRLILRGDLVQNELNHSSLNCAIISANMGIKINLAPEKLQNLVMGALLHDVGMLRIPQEIIKKTSNLEKGELADMRTHPLHSYKIIFNELRMNKDIAIVALQHHERWDGDGYPRHISGKDISPLSQIVSIADAFEAMISERSYRNSIIGYQAMKNILGDNSRRFDPEITKMFIRSMGIYPLGSIVLMSDGSVGRVVSISDDAPLRPEVIVLVDKDGVEHRGDTGPVYNLLQEKSLFIVKAMNLQDIFSKQ